MSCECDGTGFIFFKADYATPMSRRAENTSQTRRCAGYIEYFRASTLMKDDAGKVALLSGTGLCRGAVELHKKLIIRDQKKEKKTRKEL